jgi:hypothetical protein
MCNQNGHVKGDEKNKAEKKISNIGGKATMKETTRKTKM